MEKIDVGYFWDHNGYDSICREITKNHGLSTHCWFKVMACTRLLGCKGESVRLSKFKIIAKIFSAVFCDDMKVTVHVNSVDFIIYDERWPVYRSSGSP